MVLIFDDNQYRRDKICRALRNDDLPTKGVGFEDWQYYTFPMVTVLFCVKASEIYSFSKELVRQGTIPIFVLKKNVPETKFARHVILHPDAQITSEQIKEIVKTELGYTFEEDTINKIYVSHTDREIYFIGSRLGVEKRQFSIIRFFAYNPKRIFTVDDIFEYLNLRVKLETFEKYVGTINGKCKAIYREDIIISNSFGYGISHVTGKFKPSKTVVREAKIKLKKLAFR